MSPKPSSTCATDGSAKGSSSGESSTFTPEEQRHLAAQRIGDYVTNSEHSHVEHQHTSHQQAVYAHTNAMGSYLQAFNEVMGHAGP